jgi:glucan biosynthesis protein C
LTHIDPWTAIDPEARDRKRGRATAFARRLLLACGMAAPILVIVTTLAATVAYPGLDPARQYLSELGGRTAGTPLIFNAGVFVAGLMAALAGVGFGLSVVALTNARVVSGLIAAVFVLSGYGLTQAALYHWPDPRHLAINLALGIQLAPVLFVWGLWSRQDLGRLKLFLLWIFGVMMTLTMLTKHLILPGLVNDANVGWWERAYAIILVSWVGVAALALDLCLRREALIKKTA